MLNQGLNLTWLSFSCVQKHFLGITLGYLNSALNNLAQVLSCDLLFAPSFFQEIFARFLLGWFHYSPANSSIDLSGL